MNGKVYDYEKLVSSIQKDVTVLEIDLYNQT
ncbi:toxin, partial [Enterococcus faecalis]